MLRLGASCLRLVSSARTVEVSVAQGGEPTPSYACSVRGVPSEAKPGAFSATIDLTAYAGLSLLQLRLLSLANPGEAKLHRIHLPRTRGGGGGGRADGIEGGGERGRGEVSGEGGVGGVGEEVEGGGQREPAGGRGREPGLADTSAAPEGDTGGSGAAVEGGGASEAGGRPGAPQPAPLPGSLDDGADSASVGASGSSRGGGGGGSVTSQAEQIRLLLRHALAAGAGGGGGAAAEPGGEAGNSGGVAGWRAILGGDGGRPELPPELSSLGALADAFAARAGPGLASLARAAATNALDGGALGGASGAHATGYAGTSGRGGGGGGAGSEGTVDVGDGGGSGGGLMSAASCLLSSLHAGLARVEALEGALAARFREAETAGAAADERITRLEALVLQAFGPRVPPTV
ncbi:hypothetical protein FOA52_000884 [Chlamydomonas sp. UWO 241]|nr:hypothetical protein FOA52_000884 [Chlamydomonas sp. UWO 241]